MSIFDLTLAGIIIGFLIWGIWRGLVKIAGYFFALFLAITLTSHYYLSISHFLSRFFSVNEYFLNIFSFFLLVGIFTKIIVILINIVFRFISIVPLVDSFNRIFGGILGVLIGLLISGTFLYLLTRYPIPLFQDELRSSFLAPFILKIYSPFTFFFPKILQELKKRI